MAASILVYFEIGPVKAAARIANPTFPTGLWKLRFSGFFAVKAESLQRAALEISL